MVGTPFCRFIDTISLASEFEPSLAHKRILDFIAAKTTSKAPYLSDTLASGLDLLGIESLYSHQAKGLKLVKSGKNIVVVTHTASGKSMMFNLPVLKSLSQSS